MPIINENQFFTPIIEFDVAPGNQQEFIDAIADEVERYFKSYVGFISASFHASEDGRRVINYAQWRSKEDWTASGDEASAAIVEVLKRYGTEPLRGKVGLFRVARVIVKEDEKS